MKLTFCKEIALRDFITLWAKDPTFYCNHCGQIYTKPPEGCEEIICCEKPQYGTNLQFLHALIHENKRIRETRMNQFASNKDKSLRMAISITPRLLHDMEEYCINTLKEPLWKDTKEMNDFARSFPQFRTCDSI